MPFEKWEGPSYEEAAAPGGADKMRSWLSSPAGIAAHGRRGMEIVGEANHAGNWLAATEHLHDPELVAKGRKYIAWANRGVMAPGELGLQMRSMFGATYPQFDPADVPNTIPNHLGDQFK